MSRRVFDSTVLLLLVLLMMCCGSGAATAEVKSNADASNSGSALTGAIAGEGSASGGVERLQGVDLFVPQTTQVLPKDGSVPVTARDSFALPSLVSVGGVIAAFAEGHMDAEYQDGGGTSIETNSSDVVVEYIDATWDWSALVGKVSESKWKAYTVLGPTDGTGNGVGSASNPTAIESGNRAFLRAGS
ncbi:trans-sialidase [Trypanosoma cruzi]|nr:trans-sialidase [Trypanosoma cruzi]